MQIQVQRGWACGLLCCGVLLAHPHSRHARHYRQVVSKNAKILWKTFFGNDYMLLANSYFFPTTLSGKWVSLCVECPVFIPLRASELYSRPSLYTERKKKKTHRFLDTSEILMAPFDVLKGPLHQ